jgi:hypothetical protein
MSVPSCVTTTVSGMAKAAELARIDAGLDREHHAGLDPRV